MQINQMVSSVIDEHVKLVLAIEKNLLSEIRTAVRWSIDALKRENKILFAGNGGSAADAQHLAAEFIGRFQKDRPSLPALALTTDTSILTALGNDYGFDKIFARQIEGLVKEGDIFFAISTSGNSENVIEAVKVCRKRSCSTIGLLGKNGGKLAEIVDLPIIVESDNTARIQENHIVIGHMICQLVENILFGKDI